MKIIYEITEKGSKKHKINKNKLELTAKMKELENLRKLKKKGQDVKEELSKVLELLKKLREQKKKLIEN